jgi:proteic killer suppression protein
MIKNFKCKHTQALYEGKCPKQFRTFQAQAERKLQMLDSAVELLDLRSPPGNKFEKLEGDRQGWEQRDKNQPKSPFKNQPLLMTGTPVRVRFKPDSKRSCVKT